MDEIFNNAAGEKIVVPERKNDESNFYGAGFNVYKRDGAFGLSYSSAMHGGGSVIHEITENEYLKTRDGRLSLSTLMKLYPECDGDRERSLKIQVKWAAQ